MTHWPRGGKSEFRLCVYCSSPWFSRSLSWTSFMNSGQYLYQLPVLAQARHFFRAFLSSNLWPFSYRVDIFIFVCSFGSLFNSWFVQYPQRVAVYQLKGAFLTVWESWQRLRTQLLAFASPLLVLIVTYFHPYFCVLNDFLVWIFFFQQVLEGVNFLSVHIELGGVGGVFSYRCSGS